MTLGAWLAAAAPPRVLARRARRRAGLLTSAAALGFGVFEVGRLAQGLWHPLRQVTFEATSALLRAVTPGAFSDPGTFTLGTARFAVEIAPQCSGYEGIGLTWAFLVAALWLFRDRFRFPHALVLLGAGAALPWLANVGRLVALVMVGTFVSGDLAAGGFHSYAGSILFCAVALTIIAVALRTPWLTRQPPDGAAAPVAFASPAPYLVPFLAMTAAGLVSRAFSTAGAEPLYPLRPLAGVVALAALWGSYRHFDRRLSGAAVLAGVAVAAVWFAVDRLFPAAGPRPPAPSAWLLAGRMATAVLLVPPVEELAFRGFLARRVARADFEQVSPARLPASGILVSSLAFGLLHRRPVAGVLAGLCYAWIYRRRGELADAVVAHAVTNAALVLVAALTGAWDLWR
jgi:exosortase E/protease (VPEID-CTERM system)